jgi:ATP-binding cassette subfamily F protein 3
MLLHVAIASKTIGTNQLFHELKLTVEAGEKIAIIGRNGVGKTTLFHMLTGEDHEYSGEIIFKKGTLVTATRQEHHDVGHLKVLDYIVTNLPEYAVLKKIIDTYPETMGDDMRKITAYSDALERFTNLGYYTIEDRIKQSLTAYQLGDVAERPLASLSGGQKRFVELIRIEHAHVDLALIDEPTNHMDYVAKAAFLEWFSAVKHAVVVITHDRDLLASVSRIIEIKDQQALSFKGNYTDYLKQNATTTATQLHGYEVTQRQIANTKAKLVRFRRLKEKARDPGAIHQFKRLEEQAEAELLTLQEVEKPTFWIDRESTALLRPQLEEQYQKHKAKTIRIHRSHMQERARTLLELDEVQVGYNHPLFAPLTIQIATGDRIRIVGRNGVGKTTLVRTVLEAATINRPATLLHGKISLDTKVRTNVYEQESDTALLDMTLSQAIEQL